MLVDLKRNFGGLTNCNSIKIMQNYKKLCYENFGGIHCNYEKARNC